MEQNAYVREEKLSEGSYAVYRARRRSDGARVILKLTRTRQPTAEEVSRLQHEHALLRSLAMPGVCRTYGLAIVDGQPALVLEDLGGRSLDRAIAARGRPDLGRFLELGLALTRIVESIHREGILHKDLKPEHFFIDESSGAITLIDFELATRLPRERPRIAPITIDGTFVYMSPEQTGRMNRAVDQRSDLYSLGVTLYELLIGKPPFTSADPLELIHSHIARTPVAPSELRADVPVVVSDILRKLLAKVAEDRYQDAGGLASDLERCASSLREGGRIDAFPLGTHDAPGVLRLPEKLYGREAEIAVLTSAFERASAGAAELLLIGGPSGGGKSALALELQKLLVRRGRFVSGKCDPRLRTPYASITQACRGLLSSILAEPSDVLETWRVQLRAAVGPHGAVVASLVPELELAIGPQPAVPVLEPTAAQHRFELAFQRFVRVFSSEAHPLVMFLDDLQWADPASLRLLHVLLTATDRGHLLVLGAYRDSEVGPVHELTLALDEMRKAGAATREIQISPLGGGEVRQLIADALGEDAERLAQPLAELAVLALEKTAGNPFFIGQFLTAIVDQGLLAYAASTRRWGVDLAGVAKAMVTDNVVDLLVRRLHRLSLPTREVVRLAACIGSRFDLETLAAVSGRTPRRTAADLAEALHAGMLVALDDRYRYFLRAEDDAEALPIDVAYQFTHDRIQQAAYSLLENEQRAAVHLQVGRSLLAGWNEAASDERLFDVVSHMNLGSALLASREERRRLAQLNLRAASRARDSVAFDVAIGLAANCLALLGSDGFQTDYEATYAAHLLQIACEAACGRTDQALLLAAALDRGSRPGLDRAAGRRLEAAIWVQLNKMSDAIAAGVGAAAMLGTELPVEPSAVGAATAAEFGALQQALAGRTIASLSELVPMTDPRALATTHIFTTILPAAAQTRPDFLGLLLCKAISISLEYGNPPGAPHFYTSYAFLVALITGDHASAYQFGSLGVELAERPAHRQSAGAGALVFASFVAHWSRHVSESLAHYQRGLRASLEVGDFIHFGYCTTHGALTRLYAGKPLETLAEEVGAAHAPIYNAGDHINATLLRCIERAVATLRQQMRGQLGDAGRRYDDGFDIAGMSANPTLFGMHLIAKTMALYFADELSAAQTASDQAQAILPYQQGMLWSVEHAFYRALLRGELVRGAAESERPQLIAALDADAAALTELAKSAPVNHAQRVALVAAERAALAGDVAAAIDAFDRAIGLAREHGFLHHEALANELCGRFHAEAGRAKIARVYIVEAYRGYRQWGASIKLQELGAHYPELLAAEDARSLTFHGTSRGALSGLDLATAVRMTQAIASELMPSKLIERLMRSLVEHAGAQRGFLIVPNAEQLEVHASITVEPDVVRLGLAEPLDATQELSSAVVRYVARSREAVVLADAVNDSRFRNDPYMLTAAPKSVLCVAMLHHGRMRGLLYLENNAAKAVFDPARIELLHFLAAQAATAIENAALYEELEQRVKDRTAALASANERLKISLKELNDAQRTLVDMSRRAGMAEVATSILHNVGNMLNSINVSAELIASHVRQSKSAAVGKLAQLLDEHRGDLATFLAEDERGRRIPDYLAQLAARVDEERVMVLDEVGGLQKNIEHVNAIVAMQQTHAKGGDLLEDVSVAELVEHAIRLSGESAAEHAVDIVRESEALTLRIDRHKILQVLLNVVRNAREAVQDADDRRVFVRCRGAGDKIVITVEDHGVGIPKENLPRVFEFGFTTKPEGHGFGLHSCAITASELGGSLSCESAGPGRGAKFTLELPRVAADARLAS